MQHISRMNVLESPQHLVEEVAHVVIAEVLCLQQLIQVCLHQSLNDVAEYWSGRNTLHYTKPAK